MQNQKRKSGREGMTLIEVMLVLFILMTIASVSMLAVTQYRAKAKNDFAKTQLGQLAELLDIYEGTIGNYPSTEESLEALCACPPSVDPSVWVKTALWSTPPLDPWGNRYNYQYPGSGGMDTFDLWSNGPDGQTGTEDDIAFKR